LPSENPEPLDLGLLSPVTVGHDDPVADAAVAAALVEAEVALVRAFAALGATDAATATAVADALGGARLDVASLAAAGVAGGNPVIPLVGMLRAAVPAEHAAWVHRGATSQDVLDTALMLVARRAAEQTLDSLRAAADALAGFAARHRDLVAAARTLTQHAVPTTVGARAAGWTRGIRRAIARLESATAQLPAQFGGAAGTLAATVDEFGPELAAALPSAYAKQLGLTAPDAPWHTTRWPVTELADALVQAIDALGVVAADVATLSRTEIGELAEGAGGGSSAMPQKQNPVDAVLIRSAALRAPQLGATLHLAAASAVDERPDGAWHAEWPTLRELLRLALGAAAHGERLASGLQVDADAVARNLDTDGGRIVAERLGRVLTPLIGRERFAALLGSDAPLADAIRSLPEAAGLDVDALLDPAGYTGLAGRFVDELEGGA
jgi:3-carboxy-cis,cis-muconate cycloisomerase